MVESFHSNNETVLSSYQFVLQLCHVSFISWLSKVVGKNIDEDVKEDNTGKDKVELASIGRKDKNTQTSFYEKPHL